MKYFKRLKAIRAAKIYLCESGIKKQLTSRQRQELINLRKAFHNEKMGTWPERVLLFNTGLKLPENACVVEIGSWVGVSTSYIACGMKCGKGGKLYAVDTFEGTTMDETKKDAWKKTVEKLGGTSFERFKANVKRFNLESIVTPIKSISVEAAKAWDKGMIHFLYIDGDHVYEAVKQDYAIWSPYVKRDGIIGFHDYDKRHPGVKRFVDELLQSFKENVSIETVDSIILLKFKE
ncbi:MAG: class I SAM-dependent methyltransferase [Nitrospirota bacterium]